MRGKLLIFMLIGCLAGNWKAKGAIVTDEHLLAVGNNEDGNGMLVVTSKLASSVTVFTLNGLSISAACGPHPSRCRELMVQSTRLSDLISKHTVLIPLENGLQVFEFYHNGTSNELNISSQHTLMFNGISGNSNCSSMSAYKIGASYYQPCITSESLYICTLTLNMTVVTRSTIQSCQRMLDIGTVGFTSLSNIVLSNETFIPRRHLLFLIQSVLYRLFPVTSVLSPTYDFSRQCSQANQLILSPKGDGELLLYCFDRTSIVYSTDFDEVVNLGGLESVQYPCSPSAEFIIHLSQNQMDLSYKIRSNGSDTVKIFLSPTISNDYYSGICFANGNHHLFAYIDRSVGVFLFNATSRNFILLPSTCCCGAEADCELILVYNSQYLVVRNKEERRITVYGILQGQVIIVLQDKPFPLVSLIHDIHVVHFPTESITTSTNPMNTMSSNFMENSNQSLDPGVIAVIVLISSVIVILFSAIIAVIIFVAVRIRKQRLSAKYSPTQVQRSADVAIQGGNEQAKKSSLDAAAETVMNSDEGRLEETAQLPVKGPGYEVDTTDQENPDDTEKLESVGESEVKADCHQTEDTKKVTRNQMEAVSLSESDDAACKNEASDKNTQLSEESRNAPKIVQQRIQESASVPLNSQTVSEEKTDSLYPLRTQEKDSQDVTEES